jgi:hypothetical protein
MRWKAYEILYTAGLIRIQFELGIHLDMNSVTIALLTIEYF